MQLYNFCLKYYNRQAVCAIHISTLILCIFYLGISNTFWYLFCPTTHILSTYTSPARFTHGWSAESAEERSARVQATPHLHVVVRAVLLLLQLERKEREVHVHVGFGFDRPFARGIAVVVQIAVVGMRVKVFHVVRGNQPATTNCKGGNKNGSLEVVQVPLANVQHNTNYAVLR